jgi:hypothetical protein
MKTTRLFPLALVLLLSLVIGILTVSAAEDDLVGLTIKNRTDRFVFISLLSTDGSAVYFLAVPSEDSRTFTVPREVYSHTTVACGETAIGTLDVTRFTTLTFTPCGKAPANPGEPSIEKIHLFDSPEKSGFSYQID